MTAGSILRGIAILLALQWVSVLFLQALHIAFPPALLGMILLAVLLLKVSGERMTVGRLI